jgi:endonuclease/exonuclease/phosphatase (EEP) superfamily protein YafD
MTQNAKVDKVLNIILVEKNDNAIEKRCIDLKKTELAQLILFLISTKSLKEELAVLVGTNQSEVVDKAPQDTQVPEEEGEDDGASWSKVTTNKKKRVCRSTYKGVECGVVSCDFAHPTICMACKERRDPKCKLWHVAPAKPKPKSTASKSSALGKGSRGKVPFSSSNPKGNHNKDYSGLKRKLAVSETQCLRAELALIKVQRSNPAPSRRKYSSVVSPLAGFPAPTQAVSTPALSTPRCGPDPCPDGAAVTADVAAVCGETAGLVIMTWNAANLARSVKELSLSHLLNVNKVDVAIITEAELPATMATTFSIDGYTLFLPVVGPTEKTRVLALIKSDLAVRACARLQMDLMTSSVQTVWLELNQPNGIRLVIGGVYRQWTSSSLTTPSHHSGLAMEREQLDIILNQVRLASQTAKAIIALGDFNLDAHRSSNASYSRRSLLRCLAEGMEAAGLDYVPTPSTWRSYGSFAGGHHVSCLDHVYCTGVDADVEVLKDSTSDHRPVLARIKAVNRSTSIDISLNQRVEMQAALQLWPWGDIYDIEDVEKTHKFIVRGITVALDVVAPYKTIRVRSGDNLYLSSDTLDLIGIRDQATGKEYCRLRNKVSSMVKRDRLRTNLDKLRKANNDPKVLWGLANSALGKSQSSLPALLVIGGISTVENTEAAAAMNGFYVEKVEKLRADLRPVSPPPSSD